jgi:hypothetical protein
MPVFYGEAVLGQAVCRDIPCEQQLLIELAINSGDFYVMFQRENHFINERIQKP